MMNKAGQDGRRMTCRKSFRYGLGSLDRWTLNSYKIKLEVAENSFCFVYKFNEKDEEMIR
jgi:hypothetical protein